MASAVAVWRPASTLEFDPLSWKRAGAEPDSASLNRANKTSERYRHRQVTVERRAIGHALDARFDQAVVGQASQDLVHADARFEARQVGAEAEVRPRAKRQVAVRLAAEVEAIRNGLTKRVLDMLSKLVKDESEKYKTFWKEFGTVLKEGLPQDSANRATLLNLLRFASTHDSSNEPTASLAQYVERMKHFK